MFVTGPDVVKTVTHEAVTQEELGGRDHPHDTLGRRRSGVRERHRGPARDPPLRRLPAAVEPREAADPADRRSDRAVGAVARHLGAGQPEQALRHEGADREGGRRRRLLRAAARLRAQHPDPASRASTAARSASSPTSRSCWPACLDIALGDQGGALRALLRLLQYSIVTFVDVPGFLPGTAQEFGGIIKHGAKAAVRLCRGDRAQSHRDHAQGLWRGLRRHVLEAFARRRQLCLADRRDRGDGGQGRGRDHLPRRYRRRPQDRGAHRGIPRQVRQPVRRRVARLYRRRHPAAQYAPPPGAGARDAAQQDARESLEKTRQTSRYRHVQKNPDREPRRDRPAASCARPSAWHQDGRGLFRARRRRAACPRGRRGGRDRAGGVERELPQHRPHRRGRRATPAPRRSIRATASCPSARPSPRRWRRPASPSSARRRRRSPRWATRSSRSSSLWRPRSRPCRAISACSTVPRPRSPRPRRSVIP